MSITFYIATEREDGCIVPAESCDCSRRWCDDCDTAWDRGEDAPEMYTCEVCDAEVNLANGNALDLLAWLGLTVDYCGQIPASELAPKLRRRLWDESRNHDPAIAGEESGGPGTGQCRAVYTGRRPGYLRERCEQLLATCERAGDRLIAWA
jgi:hypothetical protein